MKGVPIMISNQALQASMFSPDKCKTHPCKRMGKRSVAADRSKDQVLLPALYHSLAFSIDLS
jgi:hypothetical protein